ncbi:hypothetical protein HK102_006792 [Quaeritorhiza haematococci]|nr:hypothetical protein HK102_006792 [Quaeritorhiza haematococci]
MAKVFSTMSTIGLHAGRQKLGEQIGKVTSVPASSKTAWSGRPKGACRCFRSQHMYSTVARSPEIIDVDTVVIGGGVVGLAVAERLSRPSTSFTSVSTSPSSSTSNTSVPVVLLERHPFVGQETSSRNSEVIHAGIYYPPDSLKTALCVRGRRKLYELCERVGIPFRNTGKWIVAQDDEGGEYLQKMKERVERIRLEGDEGQGVIAPLRFVSTEEMRQKEPFVKAKHVLESSTTGIVDSHAYMAYLQTKIEENGSLVMTRTAVTSIHPQPTSQARGSRMEYLLEISTSLSTLIRARSVINCAGLHADKIAAIVLPASFVDEHYKIKYCKGHYVSLSGGSIPKVSRLVYPVPPSRQRANVESLGVHLTLDMTGRLKFGPDVMYVDDLNDYGMDGMTEKRLDRFFEAIVEYLPSVQREQLQPDYCGIRPKLSARGEPFRDFVIEEESAHGLPRFVNLIGIESPGLTSSLAIADLVWKKLNP